FLAAVLPPSAGSLKLLGPKSSQQQVKSQSDQSTSGHDLQSPGASYEPGTPSKRAKDSEQNQIDSYLYKCNSINAQDAAKRLREYMAAKSHLDGQEGKGSR